jgi:hypothetical protein
MTRLHYRLVAASLWAALTVGIVAAPSQPDRVASVERAR